MPPPASLSTALLAGSRKLEYNGQTWHEHCFICSSCQQPIGSRSFIPDQKDYYCVPCYESKFAPRCTRCKKVRLAGQPETLVPWSRAAFPAPATKGWWDGAGVGPHLPWLGGEDRGLVDGPAAACQWLLCSNSARDVRAVLQPSPSPIRKRFRCHNPG